MNVNEAQANFEDYRWRARRRFEDSLPIDPRLLIFICVVLSTMLGVAVTDREFMIAVVLAAAFAVLTVWPEVSIIFLLLVCQQVKDSDLTGQNAYLTMGHQLYDAHIGAIPLVMLVVTYGAAAAVIRNFLLNPERARFNPIMLLLVGLGITIGILASAFCGDDLMTAVLVSPSSYWLVLAGITIGCTLLARKDSVRIVRWTVVGALALTAIAGAFNAVEAARSGMISSGDDALVDFVIYYSAGLPAVAAAIGLAVVFLQDSSGKSIARVLVAALSAWIVILSFRRCVWLPTMAILAYMLFRGRVRTRFAKRALALSTVMVVTSLIALPGLATSSADRLAAGLSPFFGSERTGESQKSAAAHVDDIASGWRYVRQRPILGFGPSHEQLPELVARQTGGAIYVHNEVLQSWLRYGIFGMLLIVAMFTTGIYFAVSILGRVSERSPEQIASAFFLLIVPPAAATAPFLNTTYQWPILFGIATAIASSAVSRRA